MFFGLINVSVAEMAPVKVRRVKDVCFIRVWGDHQTKLFMFHYDNLSPGKQIVYAIFVPEPSIGIAIRVGIMADRSLDFTLNGNYGVAMYFLIEVNGEELLEGRVIIPPTGRCL